MRTAPLPESERRPVSTKTIRRILQFFRPYILRVSLTVVAITCRRSHWPGQPLPAQEDHRRRDSGWRPEPSLTSHVGLMIALPVITGLIGVWQTPQYGHRPASHAGLARRTLWPLAAHAAPLLHLNADGGDSGAVELRCQWRAASSD